MTPKLLGRTLLCIGLGAAPACGTSAGPGGPNLGAGGHDATPSAVRPSAGTEPGGAASGAESGGSRAQGGGSEGGSAGANSGAGAAPQPDCPSAVPIDTEVSWIRDRCTKRIYVASGDDFRVTVSTDEGATWQRRQPANIPGDDVVTDVSIAHGVVAIIGLPGLHTSADGAATFSLVDNVAHNGFDSYGGQIAYGAGRIVLTDFEGTYTSTDGLHYQAMTPFPGSPERNGFGKHYHGRAYGNQTFIFLQDQGLIRVFDGATWTEDKLNGELTGAVFGRGMFVVSGTDGSGYVITSGDGRTWTAPGRKDAGGEDLPVDSWVIFDGQQFILYGYAVAYTSPDAVTWNKHPLEVGLQTVVFQDAKYFGLGKGNLWFSTDGLAWTPKHQLGPDEKSDISPPHLAVGRVLE